MKTFRQTISMGCALTVLACAPGEVPARTVNDPSNPAAPEAPVEASPNHLHASSTPVASDGGSVIYTCTMHPEITQSAPGKCQKCGMGLVVRTPH